MGRPMNKNNIQIYEPNKQLKLGFMIWSQMFEEFWESRELIWRLFIRDLTAKYKQSLLGYIWIMIMPFIAIGTFMYLNKAGILVIGETELPYPLFALIGFSVFQLFSTGINSGCQSLVSAGDMIAKINFPREVLVFSSIAYALFEFLIKLFLIVILFIVYKFVPSWGILLLPFSLLPILILTLGLSLILSLINGILRDTANVVALLSTFLMFLTPVFYPLREQPFSFVHFNPLAPLINAPRDLIAYGYIKEPTAFYIASAFSIIVFLISWRIFHLVETKIPERI